MKALKEFRTWGWGLGLGFALWVVFVFLQESWAAVGTVPAGGGVSAGSVNTKQHGTASLTNLSTGTNGGDFRVLGALNVEGVITGSGGNPVIIQNEFLAWGPAAVSELDENGSLVVVGNTHSIINELQVGLFTNTGYSVTARLIVQNTSELNGATNNGSITNGGNIYNTGSMTNGTGFTNGAQMQVNGTANFHSNAVVAAGIGAASNAWIGGTYYQEIGTAFTNLNGTPATLTNLATVSIAGHTLTNTGDRLVAEWGIVLQIAKANTNRFQIFYGGATVLDTGLQISSNCTVRAGCTIARKTGLNSQHVEAWLHWGPAAVPFVFTNTNFELAENNGVANTLGMKGSSQAVGAHTNNYFVVEWKPGSR